MELHYIWSKFVVIFQIIFQYFLDHPPISALQVYGKNYYMDGKWELAANMHTNSLTGK